MEKAVKGATKIKLAAPKAKYVEAILSAANSGEAGVARKGKGISPWDISRSHQGDWPSAILPKEARRKIACPIEDALQEKRLTMPPSGCLVQTQGTNIRRYYDYLVEKARGYRDTKVDYVKSGSGRLKWLTIDKGLLRETETVQRQIGTLLRCDLLGDHDPDNELILTAFRLLTLDLLELFKCMNEGAISVLENYFEMSRPDAERALNIYKAFGKQTDQIVQYLTVARQYESLTRLEVPSLKHAPTSLATSLEEYLNDPDFEVNRRQYLAQGQGGKGRSKPASAAKTKSTPFDSKPKAEGSSTTFQKPPAQVPAEVKGPAPDLIDFFDSIEQNQQPMAQPSFAPQQPFSDGRPQAQQYHQPGFAPQQTDVSFGTSYFQTQPQQPPLLQQPYQQSGQPLQPSFTGAGFGGYTTQPQQTYPPQHEFHSSLSSIPQSEPASFEQQQYQQAPQPLQPQPTSTNPFRQSMLPTTAPAASTMSASPLSRQSTNPFAKNLDPQPPQNFTASTNTPPPFTNPNQPPFTSLAAQTQTQTQTQTQQQELQQSSQFFSTQLPSLPEQVQTSRLAPQKTGTNPFARSRSSPPSSNMTPIPSGGPLQPSYSSAPPLLVVATGSTNPFRQSQLTANPPQGWQSF